MCKLYGEWCNREWPQIVTFNSLIVMDSMSSTNCKPKWALRIWVHQWKVICYVLMIWWRCSSSDMLHYYANISDKMCIFKFVSVWLWLIGQTRNWIENSTQLRGNFVADLTGNFLFKKWCALQVKSRDQCGDTLFVVERLDNYRRCNDG